MADPPLVRERAGIRSLRSRGTFQVVFGAVLLVLGVVGAFTGFEASTTAIALTAGVLVLASGIVARRIARGRLARFEAEHGVRAGLIAPRAKADAEPGPPDDASTDGEAVAGGGRGSNADHRSGAEEDATPTPRLSDPPA